MGQSAHEVHLAWRHFLLVHVLAQMDGVALTAQRRHAAAADARHQLNVADLALCHVDDRGLSSHWTHRRLTVS